MDARKENFFHEEDSSSPFFVFLYFLNRRPSALKVSLPLCIEVREETAIFSPIQPKNDDDCWDKERKIRKDKKAETHMNM